MKPHNFPHALARALAVALVAFAVLLSAPALAGPDFVTADRSHPLAASDGRTVQQPLDDILFEHDSAALFPVAQAQIASAARWLEVHPDHYIIIAGHADSSGPADHNEDIATRRSEIVNNHLIACGVAADRILLAVYGENRAKPRPSSFDRRVVMYASAEPISRIISSELDRDAIAMVWTRGATKLRESRGITPVIVASRR